MRGGTLMANKDLQRSGDTPETWPGAVTRIVEIATESPKKLAAVCALILLVALAGAAWWWLPRIW
jgi:hypothetical protein